MTKHIKYLNHRLGSVLPMNLKQILQSATDQETKICALKKTSETLPGSKCMCIHHRQELVPAVQDVIDSGVLPVLKKLLISEESEDELILRVINLLEGLAGGTLDQLRVVVDEELLQQLAPICRFRFQEFYYDIPEGVSSLLEAACFTCMREGDRAFLNRAMEFMVPLADFKPKVTASFMCRIVIMWNKKFKFSSLVVTEFFPRFFDWR